METKYHFKHNPIVRNIFISMLIPTILMNLTTALASFADTVIIGYFLDDLSLSVVTYATPVYMIINTFAALFAVGGSIAMSIDSGKGEKKTANASFSLSLEMLILTGGVLLLTGIIFSDQIPLWLGAGAQVYDRVCAYATIILVSAPIFMLNIGLSFLVRNDGRPTLTMVGMLLSIVINIVFDVIFIGLCGLGVAGAAYATALGQLVSLLVIGSHFFSKKNTLRFRLTMNLSAFRIIKNGASTALHFVYQFLSILILNHYLSALAGESGVVVYTVVFNLYTVSLALFEGLSQTIQPMISLYYGEKSHKKIKDTFRLVLLATIMICGSVTVLLELVPQIVPTIFGISDTALLQQSSMAVRIYGTSMIIMTVNVIIGYYLQSTEYSFLSAVLVSLRCFVLFLGSAFVLGKLFGMNGIWASYATAEVLTFLLFLVMNRTQRRKLAKSGIQTDLFLLDKQVANNTICLTYHCQGNDYGNFKQEVLRQLEKAPGISECILEDAAQYLSFLEPCIVQKKGTYIEAEIIGTENKLIIRDNLNHDRLQDRLRGSVRYGSKAEYGPVLGWNRICLEGGTL